MILNVVLCTSRDYINHLSINDIEQIIQECRPKLCLLTHFGMTMIKAKPWVIAQQLSERTGIDTIAASDGMTLDLASFHQKEPETSNLESR